MVKGQKAHTNCLTQFTMSAFIFLTICKCRTAWEIQAFSWVHSHPNIEWATSSLCLPKEVSKVWFGGSLSAVSFVWYHLTPRKPQWETQVPGGPPFWKVWKVAVGPSRSFLENNKNSEHLFSVYFLPGTVWSASPPLSHLILVLTASPCGRRNCTLPANDVSKD